MNSTAHRPVTITAPEGTPFIDIEREFDAPVEAVFRAHADPALLARWMGPHGYEMLIDEHDFRTGGSWAFRHRDPSAPEPAEYGFRGVFHVVRENAFVIQTFEFLGVPDVVSIEALTFTDLGDGRTRLTGRSTYPSVEARDGMVASGMETGVVQGYERLDDVLIGA